MMSPENLARLRQSADVRGQVRICSACPSYGGASLLVVARYVRVFSGFLLGAFPGRTVRFRLPLAVPTDESLPMLGDGFVHRGTGLQHAAWLEVYLDREADHWRLVQGQALLIKRPTWRPVWQ